MPYRYRVNLPPITPQSPRDPAPSWGAYKQTRIPEAGHPRICHVVAAAAPLASRNPASVWPTLVLGSECLRLRNPQDDRAIELLPEALRDELEAVFERRIRAGVDRPLTAQERNVVRAHAADVHSFVDQLVQDRTGRTRHSASDDPEATALPAAATEQDSDLESAPVPAGPPSPPVGGGRRDIRKASRTATAPQTAAGGTHVRAHVAEPTLTSEQERAAHRTASDASERYSDAELQLMIATATLTECYYNAKLRSVRSLSRSSLDTIELGPPDSPLVRKAEEALSDLAAVLKPEAATSIRLLDVVKAMRDTVGGSPGALSLANLHALTEITWSRIMARFSLYSWYPEWPDFLVRLGLDAVSRPLSDRHPRPAVASTSDAAPMVRRALEKATTTSAHWYDTQQPVDESARVTSYAMYARLLRELAFFRRGRLNPVQPRPVVGAAREPLPPPATRGGAVPPPATAFVTTFDLELEFALAQPDAAGKAPGPFVVAVPVNLVDDLEGNDSHQRLGTTMWLGCVIRPERRGPVLDRVSRPGDDAWFVFGPSRVDTPLVGGGEDVRLLRAALPDDVARLGELPILIRLAGSPLMELPHVQGHDGAVTPIGRVAMGLAGIAGKLDKVPEGSGPDWGDPKRGGRIVAAAFEHATLLDEHNAIRASLPEAVQESGRGLPKELTDGAAGDFWRFWLLLGVEVSDPVIRYRVVAQVLSASLLSPDQSYLRPERRGIALNRRPLNTRAMDLLTWCGFDVVRDVEAPGPLAPELAHFLAHLAGDVGHWPRRNAMDCALDEGADGREGRAS